MSDLDTKYIVLKLLKRALIGLSRVMNRICYIAILIPIEMAVFGHYFILFYKDGDKDISLHRKRVKNKLFLMGRSCIRKLAQED